MDEAGEGGCGTAGSCCFNDDGAFRSPEDGMLEKSMSF